MLYRIPRVSPGVTAPILRSPPSRTYAGPPSSSCVMQRPVPHQFMFFCFSVAHERLLGSSEGSIGRGQSRHCDWGARRWDDGCGEDLRLTKPATMGDQGPNSLRFSGGDAHGQVREESNLVGVGIVFQPVEDGTLYVKRMREDSPAARSGLIQIGDCLCEVNGRCARPPVVLCSARAVPSFPVAR